MPQGKFGFSDEMEVSLGLGNLSRQYPQGWLVSTIPGYLTYRLSRMRVLPKVMGTIKDFPGHRLEQEGMSGGWATAFLGRE